MSMFGDPIREMMARRSAAAAAESANAPPPNRSGPATPPPIPMPANQNPMAGGYMGQAFSLSGVPTQQPAQHGAMQPGAMPPGGINPAILQYLQALGGGIPNQQMLQGGSIDPRIMYALQALRGRM